MNKFARYSILILLLLGSIHSKAQHLERINEVKSQFKIDKRTAIFEIEYIPATHTLKGKTNLPLAKSVLLDRFKSFQAKDSIIVLPHLIQGQLPYAIANVSVANLRSHPEESAELASQVLLGTPLKIFEKQKGWYRVQCPDQYIGWIDASTVKAVTADQLHQYQQGSLYIFTDFYGKAYRDTISNSLPIRDLTFGNIFVKSRISGSYIEVIFPDKIKGYIPIQATKNISEWLRNTDNSGDAIGKFSLNFLGTPYLWGGTSSKGVDCSGFTRMSYLSQGLLLPRDASQQALIGDYVNVDSTFRNLRVGDLLFFGNKETKRVVHVAIWVGKMSFIHSSGMVKIESFDPESHNYSEYNLNRFLFAKRIKPENIQLKSGYLYDLPK